MYHNVCRKEKPWDWAAQTVPFGMEFKPPRKISAMTAEVNRGDGEHGNCDLISLDGEIDPENPKQVWRSGKNSVYTATRAEAHWNGPFA